MLELVLLTLVAAEPLAWSPIEVTAVAQPLMPDGGTHLGPFTFRGAVELTSPEETFGGLSGLRWWNGKLYALSDKRGKLFRLTPREVRGELVGIAQSAEMTSLAGITDGEALEFENAMWVSNEGTHTLSQYPLLDGGISATASTLELTGDAWGLSRNGGFEAVALERDCALLLTENARTGFVGPLRGLAGPNLTELPWPADFSPTDAAWSPRNPNVAFVLLRKFKDQKVSAALGRLTVRGCGPKDFSFELLAEWTAPTLVDNMEGLAIVAASKGVELYLVSDDNFRTHGPQRTLLFKFALTE